MAFIGSASYMMLSPAFFAVISLHRAFRAEHPGPGCLPLCERFAVIKLCC